MFAPSAFGIRQLPAVLLGYYRTRFGAIHGLLMLALLPSLFLEPDRLTQLTLALVVLVLGVVVPLRFETSRRHDRQAIDWLTNQAQADASAFRGQLKKVRTAAKDQRVRLNNFEAEALVELASQTRHIHALDDRVSETESDSSARSAEVVGELESLSKTLDDLALTVGEIADSKSQMESVADQLAGAITRIDKVEADTASVAGRIDTVMGESAGVAERLATVEAGEVPPGSTASSDAVAELTKQLAELREIVVSTRPSAGGRDDHYLAAGYRIRGALVADFDDTENTDRWQREVYDYALGVANAIGAKRLCDFGCGSGFKLMERFSHLETVGYDLAPTIEFLKDKYPDRAWQVTDEIEAGVFDGFDVVIAADVIEHLADPGELLEALSRSTAKEIVLSTPAREVLAERGHRPLGPPRNPFHYVEWTSDEFAQLVGDYLEIVEHRVSDVDNATQLMHCRRRASR